MQGLLFSVLEQGRGVFDQGTCDLVACAAAFELLEPLASRGPVASGAGEPMYQCHVLLVPYRVAWELVERVTLLFSSCVYVSLVL